ncbi:hypothetical protein Sango_1144100 [Sesamum angolense]|uniref:DDE Tnp4 domain-containing protein n=1 Tax=Sesamum angolense TaxID=2727404 RepID=A0AAE1WVM0_9LAMI|nr:hypothetical protein Sango_1144100 [Sesamum angolense]
MFDVGIWETKVARYLVVKPGTSPDNSRIVILAWLAGLILRQTIQGCLGALDGTFIDVRVPEQDKGRYRTRKGHIAVNVLGVCNPNMQFIYVMPGWEGSAADSRVLHDAIHRPHGLRVPSGGPQSPHELFNLNHSATRNVIERAFGLLKVRWGILRSQSFYPINTLNKIMLACCLLHNFLRNEMPDDPLELEIPDQGDSYADANVECISSIDTRSGSGGRTFQPPPLQIEDVGVEQPQDTQDCYIPTAEWNPKTGFVGQEEEPPVSYNLNIDPTISSSSATKRPITSSKKRKLQDAWPNISQLVSMVTNFCDTTNTRLGCLTRVLEKEFGNPDQCVTVLDAVKQLPGLQHKDCLLVA